MNKTEVLNLLQKYNLFASKKFSQNFLVDESAINKIVEAAEITPTDHILEIGPGLGSLTEKLCEKAKKVTAIELDRNIIPIVTERLARFKNLEIVESDALKFIAPETPYKIVANIPYSITSPLFRHFLQAENKPVSITLVVQKEVADKVCGPQGQNPTDHSIISLEVALFATAKQIKTIKKGAFYPMPKIDSAIIHLKVYGPDSPNFIPDEQAKKILSLAHIAYSQKRKKLRNTLGKILSPQAQQKIDLNRRPEELSIKQWQELLQFQQK